jgi:hypothetical protein
MNKLVLDAHVLRVDIIATIEELNVFLAENLLKVTGRDYYDNSEILARRCLNIRENTYIEANLSLRSVRISLTDSYKGLVVNWFNTSTGSLSSHEFVPSMTLEIQLATLRYIPKFLEKYYKHLMTDLHTSNFDAKHVESALNYLKTCIPSTSDSTK